MSRVTLVGLVEIVLRTGLTIRLCDGGFVVWNGNTFRSSDPIYGTIGGCQPIREGTGDDVPALTLTLLPPATAGIVSLSQGANQRSIARMWVAEVDPAAGTIVGTPSLHFRGFVERMTVKVGTDERSIEVEMASSSVRLMEARQGNRSSSATHKAAWPGETGMDGRTGVGSVKAWGVAGPPRGTTYSFGGGGIAGGGVFGQQAAAYV